MKTDQKNLSRREAASELGYSESSIDVLIRRRMLPAFKDGHHVRIPAAAIARLKGKPLPKIWPPKQHGKTTRHFAPQPAPPHGNGRGGPEKDDAKQRLKKPPARGVEPEQDLAGYLERSAV